MQSLNISYDAQYKHLIMTVVDTSSTELIELRHFSVDKQGELIHSPFLVPTVHTWRCHEAIMERLNHIAMVFRLAAYQDAGITTDSITPQMEQLSDLEWLFDDESKHYSLQSQHLEAINATLDFHCMGTCNPTITTKH